MSTKLQSNPSSMSSPSSSTIEDGSLVAHSQEGTTTTAAPPVVKTESSLKSFLAGGVGGICVALVGHPFDLIKVRMQTGVTAGSGSVLNILRQTLATEGILGIYRGVSAPITAATPIYALSFWGYDIGKRVVLAGRDYYYYDANVAAGTLHAGQALTIGQICLAGGISAFPCTLLMTPTERIKCLLQIQSRSTGPPQYSGMVDCAQQVFRQGGIRGLYRGTLATLLRDVPGSIAWFGTYEVCKKEFLKLQGVDDSSVTNASLSPVAIMSAGGFAGMACWAVSIPPDVLKSRFQTAPEGTYRSLWDVYLKLMREEGPAGLFTGLRPAMIRAFPANAACFFGMEVARKALSFMD